MIKRSTAVFLIFLSFTAVQGQKTKSGVSDRLRPADLKPVGRFRLTQSTGLELISTAVHFGFRFEGDSCAIHFSLPASGGHNYLQYEVDGVYGQRVLISSNENPLIITARGSGTHKIEIYKATEASAGPVFITGIRAKGVKALAPSAAPLIEFIGNSITCGAASDSSGFACSAGGYYDHHNAYMAYGPRVARALGVDYLISSVSGIGIYRTWNAENPSMPQVYENTDLHPGSSDKWNFRRFRPAIVSIALGTNDLSHGDGKTPRPPFDSAVYVSRFVKFVAKVKSKYPAAQIVLLSSPMIRDSARILLQNCLLEVKRESDTADPSGMPVVTFFFNPMNPHGCGGHPSVSEQGEMAEELLPLFKKLVAGIRN